REPVEPLSASAHRGRPNHDALPGATFCAGWQARFPRLSSPPLRPLDRPDRPLRLRADVLGLGLVLEKSSQSWSRLARLTSELRDRRRRPGSHFALRISEKLDKRWQRRAKELRRKIPDRCRRLAANADILVIEKAEEGVPDALSARARLRDPPKRRDRPRARERRLPIVTQKLEERLHRSVS